MWIYFSPNQSQNVWSWLFKKFQFGLETVIFWVKSHLVDILIYNNTWEKIKDFWYFIVLTPFDLIHFLCFNLRANNCHWYVILLFLPQIILKYRKNTKNAKRISFEVETQKINESKMSQINKISEMVFFFLSWKMVSNFHFCLGLSIHK